MKKIAISFLLFFCVTLQATSYQFTRLDNTNGLTNNQIESIFRDSRGFMWFGTNYGLNRYDGYTVKTYKADKNDSTTLLYNAIPEMQEDYQGNLWIKGNPYYVLYDVRKETFIRNLSAWFSPRGIHFQPLLVDIDSEKNMYFYNQNNGVYKYEPATGKVTAFLQNNGGNSLSKGTISGLRASGNSFWVLFQSGLMERFNEKTQSVDFRSTKVLENAIGATIPKNLYVDRNGCPWVFPGIGDKGVFTYDFSKAEWIYFGANPRDFISPGDKTMTTDFVRDIVQDLNGKVWIGTDHGGVNIYDKKTGQIEVLLNDPNNPNSISQNSVISLFADETGIMWAGTYKNGVSYCHEGMFKFGKSPLFYFNHPQLENKDCNTLYEDSKGNLWIGTNGSGLLRYQKSTGAFKVYRHDKNNPASVSSDIVISALEDRSGTLWFGTFLGGLNRMRGENFERFLPQINNPGAISNKSIYGMAEDDQNRLWIATLGAGVEMLDAERKVFTHYNRSNTRGLSSEFVLSMFTHNRNPVYLSTAAGVDVLNTASGVIKPVFSNEKLRNKLSDMVVTYSMVDSRNLLWIATDNGINIYNPLKAEILYINKTNGLPSEQVVSLVEDNEGNVWAGTRNGLACVYVKVDTKNAGYDFNVLSFDENDGLVNTIFNQNAVFKNAQGDIYFGGTKGYTVFNPQNIRFNKSVPVPRITGLMIANEEVLPGRMFRKRVVLDESVTHIKKLVLNYYEKNFTLYFSALSYIHPEKNHYRYMLKGLDTKWIETKNGQASYSNLGQGSYQLMVYASNNDNVWCAEPLVLDIVIRPPFWFSWWAILIYFAAALYLIWLIVQYNLRKQQREFESEQRIREARQLHEMDEMKFRFFTNISHEFRTPLTLILNPAEKLAGEINNPGHLQLLEIICRNANGLLELVNQLLDFRKLDENRDTLNASEGDVVAFIREICYSFSSLAGKKSVDFLFSTSVNELRMEFDAEKLRKIVNNLLSNAFKFTPEGGKIDLKLSLIQQLNDDSKYLKIDVADTGIGIPGSDINRIFERFYRVENQENGHHTGTGVGLHIVSEYVKLHGGEVSVESTPGKGSVFTVLIPARQQLNQEVIVQNTATDETSTKDEVLEHCDAQQPPLSDEKAPLMLIVDDNEDFRNFISSIFEKDYRIITAADGEKGLKLTLAKLPDLIISDVMMPVMDGFEFCRQLKQDIRTSHIPVILLTAKTGDENKYQGLEAGAEDYISKPFRTELLMLKVSRLIERQKQKHEQFKRKVDINPSEIEITSMDEKFVKKAVALVETNIGNADFLVEDLCREMAMSRVYFYKKILSLTDKTPSEFIRFIRLKRAADLLRKSQLFVNEVAYQVGFNDPKYFRKYFKDEFGMSPNEYKKQFEK